MRTDSSVVVYGAAGHTGRFVVAELLRSGISPVLAGRAAAKLDEFAGRFPDLKKRVASIDDAGALDRMLDGALTVINCAGPFIDTSAPMIMSAVRNGVHYLDIAAEQAAVHNAFVEFDASARAAGIVVAPACGFYGGLSDLVATVAMNDWTEVDEIDIAVALDSWAPTKGTRLTGEKNPGQRYHFTNGALQRRDGFPSRQWQFPAPFDRQEVVSLALSEAILIPSHLRTREIRFFLNTKPLSDLGNPDTPAPTPADERGRSSQIFLMEVSIRRGEQERRAHIRGRDIYAITAPIVGEAARRLFEKRHNASGVRSVAALFDARDFLAALSRADPTFSVHRQADG
jgi:Saccharopine dehydrogenase NADP binding domain